MVARFIETPELFGGKGWHGSLALRGGKRCFRLSDGGAGFLRSYAFGFLRFTIPIALEISTVLVCIWPKQHRSSPSQKSHYILGIARPLVRICPCAFSAIPNPTCSGFHSSLIRRERLSRLRHQRAHHDRPNRPARNLGGKLQGDDGRQECPEGERREYDTVYGRADHVRAVRAHQRRRNG